MGTQTLRTFIASLKADVDRFEADWIAQRAEHGAKDWPLRMLQEDWHDQFMTFLSLSLPSDGLTPHDSAEVARFNEYLTDKTALPADQFEAKWSAYEQGTQ